MSRKSNAKITAAIARTQTIEWLVSRLTTDQEIVKGAAIKCRLCGRVGSPLQFFEDDHGDRCADLKWCRFRELDAKIYTLTTEEAEAYYILAKSLEGLEQEEHLPAATALQAARARSSHKICIRDLRRRKFADEALRDAGYFEGME